MTDDEKVAQRYRELGAEEPPRALDEAILAVARRQPRRWYAPIAAAAVLVLAVAMTLNVQIEQPEMEAPAARLEKPAQRAAQAPTPQTAQAPAKAAADGIVVATPGQVGPKVATPATPAEPRTFAPDPPQAAPGPVPSAGASGALAGMTAERDQRAARADLSRDRPQAPAAAEAMSKRMEAPARSLAETPERELERIAEMRAQGRQEDADRALVEFRKRYPDYRIPEEMRARIERR